jgi:predicted ArsR family transcriptional regulator
MSPKYTGRLQQVLRQWDILRTLEASRHGLTLHQLAQELGVSERTVRRDIEGLEAAGFPVFKEYPDREGFVAPAPLWRAQRTWRDAGPRQVA